MIAILFVHGVINVSYLNDRRVVLHALRHSPSDPSVVIRAALFLKEGDKQLYRQQRRKDTANCVLGSTALSQWEIARTPVVVLLKVPWSSSLADRGMLGTVGKVVARFDNRVASFRGRSQCFWHM